MTTTEQADSRVTLCPDGKYRWVYEVPMLKNPSILIDVYKVLGISFGIVWLFNVLIISCEDGLSLGNLWGITSGFLILMGVFLVIGYVACLVPCRRHHLIKVNQLLNKNRVYVPDEDFDFVYDFLCQHCTKAKKKGK